MTLPEQGYQVKGISSKAYEHPADRAATAALKTIPRLDAVVRKLIEPLFPLRAALMEWFRAAELSCDRAAALVVRDPLAVCGTLMTIAAGAEAANLDLDAFVKQG